GGEIRRFQGLAAGARRLVPEEPSEWSPRGLLSTIDGANAATWAWILLGIGEEANVIKYADWFVAKARAHADMVPAIEAFWHKSAWTIAMEIIIANAAPPRRPPALPPADPNATTEDYDDHGAGWGGNRRKRRRPGKPKGKGRDGKDQDPAKKTDAANQQDQGWWSTRGGGKQQNQQQPWWGHAGADQWHQNTDGGVPDRSPKKIRLSARVPPNAEVDRAAIQVADYHIPGIRHRGDITEDTPEDLAAEIQHIDGQAECIIIFTAAPPCQDFSRVGDRDGHAGNRGYLFNFTAEFLAELRRRLAPRRFGFLVENVEMTPADAAETSKQLGCQPVFADAADFGWIGRPRLWWSSVDWDEITHDPSTAERWTWVLRRRWDRLRLDSPRAAPDSFDLRRRGLWTHSPAVLYHAGKVTTEVQQRWLQDSRQFAPWHYQRDAMLADDQGKLVVLTPSAKEQLHHMPKNFTAATAQGELEPRTRHRLLGNGWHWGVARRFLLASLPPTSTIQWVAALWGPAGPPMGPAPAKPTMAALQELDEEAHWQASWALEHPLAKPPPLEPAWELLLELRRRWRHDLVRIRREVLAEVHLLIDDLEEDSRTWMAARPSWIRATYSTPDKPAPTRVLAFLELLRRLGYPDLTALTEDMTDGFQMLGEIRPGPGWRRREDGKYQNPILVADLVASNADYVRRKVHTAKVGEHSEKLLLELIAEKRLGRVIGPTRPPDWLHNVRETTVADHQDVDTINEPPPGDAFLAASFPVCQTDENGELKMRRAEDWRRSGHNSTVTVADVPTHHFVASFVDLARRMAQDRRRLNAYRTPTSASQQPTADGFQDLFAALGFLTKKSKAQPPADEHVVQGVTFHIDETGVTLSPTPRRVEKILAQLRRALHDDSLTPDDASRLAGRVAFLTQAVFGAVARAATKAINARAADTAAWSNDALSPGLAAALKTLVDILPTTRPRFVPFDAAQLDMAVLYADAFFTDGERRHKAGHVPDGMNPSPHQRAANGWGYVLRIGDRVFYDHGMMPPWFVKLFVFAQIIAFAAFAKL
ncbi:unnamed protein product, partial [Symbiodinium sp. KB8]